MKTDNVRIEYKDGETPTLHVVNGKYLGLAFKIGSVNFPDDDQPIMQYDYEILSEGVEHSEDLGNEIGELIAEMIQNMLKENSLVYANGT